MDFFLSTPVLAFLAGFLVGWGILPQPEWAKPLIEKAKELFMNLFKKDPPVDPNKPSANT